jgi:hypothetical protein
MSALAVRRLIEALPTATAPQQCTTENVATTVSLLGSIASEIAMHRVQRCTSLCAHEFLWCP